jgi:hypothetical protein
VASSEASESHFGPSRVGWLGSMHVSMAIQSSGAAASGKTERCSIFAWRVIFHLTRPAMEPAADYAILQFAFENGELWPIAVLLLDNQDRLHVRSRPNADLATKIPPDDLKVIALSLNQIAEDARAGSGREILEILEDRLSNTIRISERQKARVSHTQNTLDDLYQEHVSSAE